jgi:hypothetical protein
VLDEQLTDLLRCLPDSPAMHERVLDAVFALAPTPPAASALEAPGAPIPVQVRCVCGGGGARGTGCQSWQSCRRPGTRLRCYQPVHATCSPHTCPVFLPLHPRTPDAGA